MKRMVLLSPARSLGCHLCSFSRATGRPLLLFSQHPAFRSMSSSADEVLFNQEGHAGLVTMNRPKALNSLNLNMVRLMYDRLKQWKTNDAVKLVILEGAGEKAFCAGGDIRAITENKGAPGQGAFFKNEYILNNCIGTYPKPFVSLVDGIVMGGGVGVSVHGTFRVATEKTLFAMPETGIGLVPDVGGSYFLPRLQTPGLGTFLALTGERLKGEDCLHAGVATHMCKRDKIPALKEELTGVSGLQACQDILNKYDADFGKSGQFGLSEHLRNIESAFTLSTVEEVIQRLGEIGGDWGLKLRDKLATMSPTSMKVTLRMMQEGARKDTLAECLNMECRLVMRCCEDEDFYEGVRALLVDRDNNPKWKPPTLSGVTNAMVDRYFSPLPSGEELDLGS